MGVNELEADSAKNLKVVAGLRDFAGTVWWLIRRC